MTERMIWTPVLTRSGKPVYLEIADAIAQDIQSGHLPPLSPLPPQRVLADRLGLNFSTISRAYAEAQRRGLIVSKVGQGTCVRPQSAEAKPLVRPSGMAQVDLTMNLPPEPDEPALLARMSAGLQDFGLNSNIADLLRYQGFGGTQMDRQAGADWLAPRFGPLEAQKVLVCPGAQSALLAVLTTLAQPGDVVCCDDLTFTGLRSLAAHMGIRLLGIGSDDEGLDPAVFAAACRTHAPKALYLNPTLHNPTTRTLTEIRRQAVVAVARQHRIPIIEDDAYGALPLEGPPPLALLAPELTFYIAGLAKCVGAGLRIAYMITPDSGVQAKTFSALRATSVMASPVTAALASHWIRTGTAGAVLDFIRRETASRQAVAAEILPAGSYATQPQAFHLWLKLPSPWTRIDFLTHLRNSGLGIVTSDAFAVTNPAPEAVRICIGGPVDRGQLRQALTVLAQTLAQTPAMISAII